MLAMNVFTTSFIVSKRSAVFVWPLHSDIRVSLSMATPSLSPTPHHVTWIDTDGRKEDWFWSLTVSEDTLSCSPELSSLSTLLRLPSTKLLIYKNLVIKIVLSSVFRFFLKYHNQRFVRNCLREDSFIYRFVSVINSFATYWSKPYG